MEDVYATLLLNDNYLPGALILAHSLKDAGTAKKLAVLVTTDSVSADAMTELQTIYDFIVPVERIINRNPSNLQVMGRVDLHSTFTKITLWKQTQFRKIVYMDADMVALRAPDELFNLPQPFSAAPDIGWPDLFNTGLMVLTPNLGDYYALLAMAERGISFDGADQGLLNMHFKNTFNRLSFSYNVTPSAHYQYLPAYRHFQSGVSAAHFIGKDKPWMEGRNAHQGSTPYDEMVGRWWAVYDRHYRVSSSSSGKGVPAIVQYYVQGESVPLSSYTYTSEAPRATENESENPNNAETSLLSASSNPEEQQQQKPGEGGVEEEAKERKEQEPEKKEWTAPFSTWDPSRAPPPTDAGPEAQNFPSTHYGMSSDYKPFKAPERYPDPPTGMYYEVPKTPTYQKPAPIFPWEKDAPKPSRVFAEDEVESARPTSSGSTAITTDGGNEAPVTPTTPIISVTTADPWQSFTSQSNAWDDIPEIERYIGALQKNRKGNIQVLQGYGSGIPHQPSAPEKRRGSMKLTDFPTEVERPSLPVTPAPIRRPSFWGDERDDAGELPAAEGVPQQADWDPAAQLEMLARRQSDVLANKLGSPIEEKELPERSLPFGSEGVKSPTYKPQQPPAKHMTPEEAEKLSESVPMQQPAFKGPGRMWEKDEEAPTEETPLGPTDEEKDVLQT